MSLYDTLMTIRPTPIVELNRAIAVGYRDGAERGLQELCGIADLDRLARYPFYYAACAEFELQLGRGEAARQFFLEALNAARNSMERQFFTQRIAACSRPT